MVFKKLVPVFLTISRVSNIHLFFRLSRIFAFPKDREGEKSAAVSRYPQNPNVFRTTTDCG